MSKDNAVTFKEVVISGLIIRHIYQGEKHDNNPITALNDIISWESSVNKYFTEEDIKEIKAMLQVLGASNMGTNQFTELVELAKQGTPVHIGPRTVEQTLEQARDLR